MYFETVLPRAFFDRALCFSFCAASLKNKLRSKQIAFDIAKTKYDANRGFLFHQG